MSGLNPDIDKILEIALIVTDSFLNILGKHGPFYIYQPNNVIHNMDAWNQNAHTKSGLIKHVQSSRLQEKDVEDIILDVISDYTNPGTNPLCGNTIYHDRLFLRKYMPILERYFHYHIIDVSSIKELVVRWWPYKKSFKKQGAHRAMQDIEESIEELRFYRAKYFLGAGQ